MLIPWLALGAFVLIALAVDIVAGSSGPPSVRRALVWSVIWTVVGAGFAGVLLLLDGRTAAEEYLAGFLVSSPTTSSTSCTPRASASCAPWASRGTSRWRRSSATGRVVADLPDLTGSQGRRCA